MIARILCLFMRHDYGPWHYYGKMSIKKRICRRRCGAYQMADTVRPERFWK